MRTGRTVLSNANSYHEPSIQSRVAECNRSTRVGLIQDLLRGLIAVDVVGVGAVVAVRLGTDLAMPGWATSAAGLSLVLLSQAVMLALLFSFVTLSGRRSLPFLPARDYAYFTGRVCALYPSAP